MLNPLTKPPGRQPALASYRDLAQGYEATCKRIAEAGMANVTIIEAPVEQAALEWRVQGTWHLGTSYLAAGTFQPLSDAGATS